MSQNPFKTESFKKLFQEWNTILEKSGHIEIEDFRLPDAPLKEWHNFRFKQIPDVRCENRVEYYEIATSILHISDFKTPIHRRIWELHAEGNSVREIAHKIKNDLKKSMIWNYIKEIEKKHGLR